MSQATNPAQLHDYDESWPVRAEALLVAISTRLSDLPGAVDAVFEHIGSTAVPGLAAKPYIDLQMRILPLPSDSALVARLTGLGFERVIGSRPDSPGVYRDTPRGTENVSDEVWNKSLFLNSAENAILHIRRHDSPWARYTVWFRDWLRAHDDHRGRYETVKRGLSAQQVGKSDYDDHTRAKTDFFDELQADFESLACEA